MRRSSISGWIACLAALYVTACTNEGPAADGPPVTSDARDSGVATSDAQGEPSIAHPDVLQGDASSTVVPNASTSDDVSDCSSDSLVCDSLRPLHKTIRQTGLFPAAPDFGLVAPALTLFQPSLELWSNGLDKKRHVLLPPGSTIDIRDRERWVPPVGTMFLK